mgnify:FL=1
MVSKAGPRGSTKTKNIFEIKLRFYILPTSRQQIIQHFWSFLVISFVRRQFQQNWSPVLLANKTGHHRQTMLTMLIFE